MPSQKPQKFQFSLKWLFVPVVLVSLFSLAWAYFHPPLRLTEVGRYPITVDYSRTLEQMIAAGKYDWVNPGITTANFPLESGESGKLALEAILFVTDRYEESEEIEKVINRLGYRNGTLRELLALGEAYPELKVHNPITALGFHRWNNRTCHRYVVVLHGHSDYRYLYLSVRGSGWYGYDRVLVFRK